jgi:chromosome partitioning protein
MTYTITIGQQKGGSGKSTLAVHLAAFLASRHPGRVLGVDTDEQGSFYNWSMLRKEEGHPLTFSVISLPKPVVHAELPKVRKDYDYIIIDTPGKIGEILVSNIKVSDLLITPLIPGLFDSLALENSVKIATEIAKNHRAKGAPALNVRALINIARPSTKIFTSAVETLKEWGYPAFETAINNRTNYPTAISEGLTAFELESGSNRPATSEYNSLVNEIFKLEGK